MRRKEVDLWRRRLPRHNTSTLSKHTQKVTPKWENVNKKHTHTPKNNVAKINDRAAKEASFSKCAREFLVRRKSGFRDGIIKC